MLETLMPIEWIAKALAFCALVVPVTIFGIMEVWERKKWKKRKNR